MLTPHQGITYNKFDKPNDWPQLDKTFDYKIENGKLLSGNEHIYLSGPVTYEKVGSPTIKDNVASGFSNISGLYNYLQVNGFSFANPFEIKCRFQYKTGFSLALIFGIASENGAVVLTNNALRVQLYSGKRIIVSNTMVDNTWYKFLYTYDGDKTYSLALYDDTDTLIGTVTDTSDTALPQTNLIRIGSVRASSLGDSFSGSIDLNETYIKVNGQLWFYGKIYSTKDKVAVPAGLEYNNTTTPSIGWVNTNTSSNFQQFTAAPEGVTIGKDETEMLQVDGGKLVGPISYTTVGSPTIVDGIASGFSADAYVKTSTTMPMSSNISQIEFGLKVTLPSSITQYETFASAFPIRFSLQINNRIQINGLSGNALQSNLVFTLGNTYYLKAISSPSETSLYYSVDGINYTLDNMVSYGFNVSSAQHEAAFGIGMFWQSTDSNHYFTGSIDINETYIKVNGALLFGKEDWTPSTYTDNAIYLLGSHSTDYSNYNTLEFTPTVSDNANYDIWIDNQKLFENKNGGTSINWQNLGLATGYSITTPSTLKAHTIKIVPTNSAKNIIAYKGYIEKAKRVFLQCKASGDYVQANNLFDLTNASTWEIQFKLNTGSNPADRYPIGSSIHTYFPDFSFHTVNYTRVLVPTTAGGSWYEVKVGSVFQTNTDYFVKYGYNNGSYWCQYSTNDGETWTDNFAPFTGPACASSAYMRVGADAWDLSYYFNGVIELSAVKVYADNVLVFDGADSTQYTVYGNPTITEE